MGGPDRGVVDRAYGRRIGRRTAVLVARLSGNVKPCDLGARNGCIDALIQAAELSGGRVLRKQSDAVMVLLNSSDAAAAAAARMQAYMASGATDRCGEFQVRIGFATGPVTQDRRDVLGDTVNLALAYSREAQNGQIITSETTAASLSVPSAVSSVEVDGTDGDPTLREVRWKEATAQLLAAHKEAAAGPERTKLRLEYGERVLYRRREWEYVSFGRDAASDIIVASQLASRRHCTVTRQGGGFTLRDHSTNGTFVMLDGQGEVYVHADECLLGKQGWISLGESGDSGSEVIQYKVLPL